MNLSERQAARYEANADAGFPSDELREPQRFTQRQLSMRGGVGRDSTTRRSVGAGTRSLFDPAGTPVAEPAAMDIVQTHEAQARHEPNHTSYAAVRWDAQGRPTDMLVTPDQVFGSHSRGPTESHDLTARATDHRGHSVAQASVNLPPGLHHATMTSQSPEMNTAVQLTLERGMNSLLQEGRRPYFEAHNEYAGDTPAGQLPRPTHQTFGVLSTDESGEDLRLHTHFRVAHM